VAQAEAALAWLLTEPGLAERLGQAGRERILAGFTPELDRRGSPRPLPWMVESSVLESLTSTVAGRHTVRGEGNPTGP
jgi:hypothetical protein